MAEKRRRTDKEEDRLSTLPLPILHHILSFRPTQDVVQTCILSKKWTTIWYSAPSISINENLSDLQRYSFTDCLLHERDKSSNIQSFYLFLDGCIGRSNKKNTIRVRVNAWIKDVLRYNVEVLRIELDTNIQLTPSIFSCKSLTELKIDKADINLPTSVSLPVLRILHLCDVPLGKEIVFSGCPLLENLIIQDCCLHYQSVISALHLKTLILEGEFPRKLRISTPNLRFLDLDPTDDFPDEIRFESKPVDLSHAYINLNIAMIEIFDIAKNAESLDLSYVFIISMADMLQDDDMWLPQYIQTPLCNLRRLKFRTSFSDSELLAILIILAHSPQIESICLFNKRKSKYSHFEADKAWFNNQYSHLKYVKVLDFEGCENGMKFLKIILDNAIVLKRMEIKTSESGTGNDSEIGEELIRYPRASSSVGILFQYPY